MLIRILFALALCCSYALTKPPTTPTSKYPVASNPKRVGQYPALTKSGGGYFYDEVLEYRVWVHPGGDDHYKAFATFEEAQSFTIRTPRAEQPIVLVLQHEHINEPKRGVFEHVKGDRISEWRVEWLESSKREPTSIAEFMQKHSKAPTK